MLGGQRSLLGGQRPKTLLPRDDLADSRYNLTEPQGVYPLDGTLTHHGSANYPDFKPWKHTSDEDIIAQNHLQKGFFEVPHVGNELLSARNIMHQLLRSKNSLDELSSNLLKAIDVHAVNNKIGQGSYKPPPRVTLTDQKREAWLRDLAQSDVPLRKLARTIPHGVRNKQLLDQCLSKNIPMNRAIWFVRCVSTNELRQLKRKGGSNIEIQWVQEWTSQVLEFIAKLSHEYLHFETFHRATESWKFNISYMLRFVSNLFVEKLIDREIFKGWVIKFFKTCKVFELPLALTFVRLYWKEICGTDYLIKELTEGLIFRYDAVDSLENMLESRDLTTTDMKLNEKVKGELLLNFRALILDSFLQSVDNFIIPGSWGQLEPVLKTVLNFKDTVQAKRFELISYRNQSLMINYSIESGTGLKDIVSSFDALGETVSFSVIIGDMLKDGLKNNIQLLLKWALTKYRHGTQRIYITSEILRRLKGLPQVSSKEMEQEILTFVFMAPSLKSQIVLRNLFLLLNELCRFRLFRVSTYMRRLISSGLIYLSTNDDEKDMHSLILRNLKPQKSSQAVMILKNLDGSDDLSRLDLDGKTQAALEIIHASDNFFAVPEKLAIIEGLNVGLRLEVADLYLSQILSRDNLFPLLTYNEFQHILKTILLLEDFRGLFDLLSKALLSTSLEAREIELICDIAITYKKLAKSLTDWEKFIHMLLDNSRRLESLNCLKKIQSLLEHDAFLSNLDDAVASNIKMKCPHSDVVKITQDLAEAAVQLNVEQILQESSVHSCFQVLIRAVFNTTLEGSMKRSILDLLNALKSLHTTEFDRCLFVYIKKTFMNSSALFKFEPLLDLIISELINLDTLVPMFLSFKTVAHLTLILDLIYKEMSHSSFAGDLFKMELLRERFKSDYPDLMLSLLKESLEETEPKMDSIQPESAEIMTNLLPESKAYNYHGELFSAFLDILTHNQQLAMSTMESFNVNAKRVAVKWLHDAVCGDTSGTLVDKPDHAQHDYLATYVTRLDRFNLQIVQLLLKLILTEDVPDDILLPFLESSVADSSGSEDMFGAMFELLDGSLRSRLLHFFESIFLNSPTFPSVCVRGHSVNLDIINDTLITLSRGLESAPLSDELVFSLDVSLESLIKVVSQTDKHAGEIYSAISLFLKILIIHKSFLINIVIERNTIKENFLNNLVGLLTTKLVSQNLQLKNLLYDLILSIKSSVNELNSAQSTTVKLPLSILSLPSISIAEASGAPPKRNEHSLHDYNITSNLFLHNKLSGMFLDVNAKPFDLVEDSNAIENINDTALSLQLFEASVEKKNPA